ncbi:fimbria/pilus outer membrane usher protein [Providencia alcalifaciens]|uniref:fimbria/pilus outer membrane usher protein n=1 Tax=Providencia alcalifaciens TaxID=126385 RepID=UPI002B061046|nr:fimbria/pilus outer membrane usher protein [Providencia alcalifaciens]
MAKKRKVTKDAAMAFRLPPLLVALAVLGGLPGEVLARDYFDPGFLGNAGDSVDLSQYETEGSTPEGTYLVDVYLNQALMATRQVRFEKDDNGKVNPVLTTKELEDMGVAVSRIPTMKGLPPEKPVGDLSALIPSASMQLDLSQLRLNISVPQADMDSRAGGYIDPKLWDDGIPAVLLNYNLSGSKSWLKQQNGMDGGRTQSVFALLNGGINVGAWRLRSTMSYSDYSSNGNGMDMITRTMQWSNTYIQRGIQRLRGELTLGEASTGGDIFDSIPFRGVQLVSNDDMLPSSERGYAPVISGIANSNAQVSVTQNGSLIYQTYVAPGPFSITDVYQASNGGDLVVTVTESDGSKHVSTQSYSTLPIMQRPGGLEYEVTVARYHNGGGYTEGSRTPVFALGTLIYGLPHGITLYGGLLGANDYMSAALGTGISLGMFGALSIDATMAKANLPGDAGDATGAAFRARYSKSMLSTGTTVDLTAYRYATSDFYSFSDINTYGYQVRDGWAPWMGERRRSSWSTSINQTLGSWGSIYLRGNRDDYWGSGRVVNSVNLGYSSSVKGIGYSVDYSVDHTKGGNGAWPTNHSVSFNVSVPLNLFSNAEMAQSMNATYSVTHDNTGRTSNQAGLAGTMLDNKASWSASQSWDNQGNDNAGNLSVSYSGSNGSGGIGYGYDSNSRNVNANLNGGLLIHRHGLTLAPMLGNAMALVSAPGVEGVKVNTGNTTTNSRGYAVAPYMSNYQRNMVSLDPTTLPDGADIENNSVNVYPTKGAVVEANFKTHIGLQALLTLVFDGKPVPFGATASLKDSNGEDNSSIVGDAGMVYLSGMPQVGSLLVQWGSGADQQCRVSYNLGEVPKPTKDAPVVSVVQQTLVCR